MRYSPANTICLVVAASSESKSYSNNNILFISFNKSCIIQLLGISELGFETKGYLEWMDILFYKILRALDYNLF